MALTATLIVGSVGCLIFQLFPEAVIGIFGQADELYNEFAVRCMKTITVLIFVMGMQILSSVYYQAVGKPIKAIILALSRQLLFMIPAILILPKFLGLDGAMYAFPVSDCAALILSTTLFVFEMKHLNGKIRDQQLAEGAAVRA